MPRAARLPRRMKTLKKPKHLVLSIADGHHSMTTVPALGGDTAATFTVTRSGDRVVIEADGASGPWSARVVGPGASTVSAEPGAARLEITL